MDTATWTQIGGVGGLGAALIAGLLFSFTPVAFASIPAVLAYVTRARAFREAVSYGSAFAAGLIITHVVLGVGAALGGAWAQNLLSRQWGAILGSCWACCGPGGSGRALPWLPLRGRRAATLWGPVDWPERQRLHRYRALRRPDRRFQNNRRQRLIRQLESLGLKVTVEELAEAGSVLRVETVINQPEAFKVRKRVRRGDREVTEWVPMRKGVANRFRYREVSRSSNSRYLEALAVVDDPTQAITGLNAMTQRKRTPAGQSVKAFNPLSEEDQRIFKALLSLSGFRNAELREELAGSGFLNSCGRCLRRQSAKISRLPKRFHIYALIAKIRRTRRWRLTHKGLALLSAGVSLREETFPIRYGQSCA